MLGGKGEFSALSLSVATSDLLAFPFNSVPLIHIFVYPGALPRIMEDEAEKTMENIDDTTMTTGIKSGSRRASYTLTCAGERNILI